MKKFLFSFFILLFINSHLIVAQPIEFMQFKGQHENEYYFLNFQFIGDQIEVIVFIVPLDSKPGNSSYFKLKGKSDKDNFVTLQSDGEQLVSYVGKWSNEQFQGIFSPSKNNSFQLDCDRIQIENTIRFERVYRNASQKLLPKDKNSPEAIIEMNLTLPIKNQERNYVQPYSNFYGWAAIDSLPSVSFEDHMRLSMAEFLTQYSQMSTIEGEKGPSFQWIKSMDGNVLWMYQRFVSHEKQTYVFTGGAHGMQHFSLGIFDSDSTCFLTSENIFEVDTSDELSALLTMTLKKQLGKDENHSLVSDGYFMEIIPVAENFCITPAGFLFHYNSYEIAPYSFGHTEIILPYDLVTSLLQPWLKEFLVNNKY